MQRSLALNECGVRIRDAERFSPSSCYSEFSAEHRVPRGTGGSFGYALLSHYEQRRNCYIIIGERHAEQIGTAVERLRAPPPWRATPAPATLARFPHGGRPKPRRWVRIDPLRREILRSTTDLAEVGRINRLIELLHEIRARLHQNHSEANPSYKPHSGNEPRGFVITAQVSPIELTPAPVVGHDLPTQGGVHADDSALPKARPRTHRAC
jgi:hypothetical protein